MRAGVKLACITLLSGVALTSATLTAYWISIWWRGVQHYPELILPICGGATAAVVTVLPIATIFQKSRGRWAVIRMSTLLTAACVLLGGTMFFAVLDNCRLSCGTKLSTESKSPSGHSKAMLVYETCSAVSRFCPTVSHVLIASESAYSEGQRQTVFSMVAEGGVEFQWLAEDRLQIRYWPLATVLRRLDHAGAIQIVYLPIPIL